MAKADEKKTRRVPDAGERLVLTAVRIPSNSISGEEQARLESIDGFELGDSVEVWLPLDRAPETDASKAIDAIAATDAGEEVPGDYRAIPVTGWRAGGERRKKPEKVELEREPLE